MVTIFQCKVQEAVRAGRQRELAVEFDVAESIVWRWSEGASKPAPKLQTMVVKYIEETKNE